MGSKALELGVVTLLHHAPHFHFFYYYPEPVPYTMNDIKEIQSIVFSLNLLSKKTFLKENIRKKIIIQ